MRRPACSLVACVALRFAAEAAAGPATTPPAPDACPRYGTARPVGHVPDVLRELSGLAASRRHPGIFWAHNDSGNGFAVYAIRESGVVVATLTLDGRGGRDPEDMAVGPCAAGSTRSCIYLGDTGDNGLRREHVTIWKLPEPEQLRSGPVAVEALPYRYPDGPHNVEALVIDPRTARLFVVTKSLLALGDVYRLDGLGSPGGGRAVRVRQLRQPSEFDSYTTAADVHPDGTRMLLRTYGRVWEFRSPSARALEDVFDTVPVAVPDATQPQGEAVAYDTDGRGYVLGSENAGSALYHIRCEAPGASAPDKR